MNPSELIDNKTKLICNFFNRNALVVALGLLNKTLCQLQQGKWLTARIIEIQQLVDRITYAHFY